MTKKSKMILAYFLKDVPESFLDGPLSKVCSKEEFEEVKKSISQEIAEVEKLEQEFLSNHDAPE